jgi:hypothetical protein
LRHLVGGDGFEQTGVSRIGQGLRLEALWVQFYSRFHSLLIADVLIPEESASVQQAIIARSFAKQTYGMVHRINPDWGRSMEWQSQQRLAVEAERLNLCLMFVASIWRSG